MLRTLGLRLLAFACVSAALVAGHALAGSPYAQLSVVPSDEVFVPHPVWSAVDAAAYPECTPSEAWPAGQPAAYLVVRDDHGSRKLAFDRAWRLNHNGSSVDDVWVVGVCG